MDKTISENENMDTAVLDNKPDSPRRSYVRKERKALTYASVSELIEARLSEIEAIQAEIEGLIVKRNELFFLESQEMGLLNVLSDPSKAKWLADMVKEAAHMKR